MLKRNKSFTLILSTVIVLFTLLGSAYVLKTIDNAGSKSFNDETTHSLTALQEQIELYVDILYAYRGMLMSFPNISFTQWEFFNKSFGYQERYTDTIEIAYTEYLTTSQLNPRVEYNFLSTGNDHYIVKFAPASGVKAIGNDLASDESRAEILKQARLTGEIVSTPLIFLRSRGEKALLFYMPIYWEAKKFNNNQERWDNFRGFVSIIIPSSELGEKLFNKIPTDSINIEVRDHLTSEVLHTKKQIKQGLFDSYTKIVSVNVAGRQWNIEFSGYRINYIRPPTVILMSLVILVSSIIYVFVYLVGFNHPLLKKLVNRVVKS